MAPSPPERAAPLPAAAAATGPVHERRRLPDPGGRIAQPICNALTFDVEDWYHGLGLHPSQWSHCEPRLAVGLGRVLDLLDAYRVKATFFVLGALVEAWRPLLGCIADAGHEIASHGHQHTPVYRLTPDDFARDLHLALAALRTVTDRPAVSYRAPFFSITARSLWALPIIARAGIAHDSSIVPAHNPRYGIAGAHRFPHRIVLERAGTPFSEPERSTALMEYPISTLTVKGVAMPFSGGFYARLLPFRLIRRAVQQINASGHPVIFYFHPWELDPDQPRIDGGVQPWYRFTHYHRLASTRGKLEALLREFRWGPLALLLPSEGPGPGVISRSLCPQPA